MQGNQPTGYRPGVIATSGVATLPDATAVSPGPASATVPPLSAEGALTETMPMNEAEVRRGYSPAREAR